MKSRILKTVGLIAAMVSCIGMTAFAAPSPAASTVVTAVSSATDTDGNAVNVSITSEIPIEYTQAVADIKTEAKLKEVIGSDFNANMTVADVKEVTAPEGAKFPLKITFVMKGVTASSKVQILHLKKVQKLLLMGNLLKNMSVKEILKSLTVTISAWNVSHSLWML